MPGEKGEGGGLTDAERWKVSAAWGGVGRLRKISDGAGDGTGQFSSPLECVPLHKWHGEGGKRSTVQRTYLSLPIPIKTFQLT